MADAITGTAIPQRQSIPVNSAHRKRKSDQDNAQTGETSGDDASDDWWAEIIHQHHTLLTSHSRILSAILKSSQPSSARHDTIAQFLTHTEEMLEQMGGVEIGAKRRRSGGSEAAKESGGKRRKGGEGEGAKPLSPSSSQNEPEDVPISNSVPAQGGKKRRVEQTSLQGVKVGVEDSRVEVEVEDIRAVVEARLKAKEKAKAKLKDGSKKRRRRSSTLEAEEMRREKRVKRESLETRKRASPEVEDGRKEGSKRRRRVT